MTPTGLQTLATFAATIPVLLAGHALGDHITQTDSMAAHKTQPGIKGWAANARHVTAYHATITALALPVWLLLHPAWHPLGILLALALSAGTHALLDRRWPVRWILTRCGSPGFAQLDTGGMNGTYLGDQALHHAVLFVCALLLAGVR